MLEEEREVSMKKTMKSVLGALCALALLAGLTGVLPAVAEKADLAQEPTLLEQILERDGLLDGIWFPWFEGGSIGHGFTGNDVMATYYGAAWSKVSMDAYGAHKIYREIYNLKAMGYNMLGFGGSVYDEGVVFDPHGDVLGVKQDYLDNARRFLDMCREIGMPVMWTICFHSSSAPDYYGMDAYNIFAQKYASSTVADHYAERFVRPVCRMLAEYPDVVALVAIADEPENEINDSELGNHFSGDRAMYGVNQENMVCFMSRINDVVREVLPNVERTVASNNMNKSIYGGFDLDLMGHNRYDNNANLPTVEEYVTDAPVIMTEYNIGGESNITDEMFTEKLIRFREQMVEKGYKGGVQWCWLSHGLRSRTAYYLLDSTPTGNRPNTYFCSTVGDLRHYMDDYRAAHRGETVVLDKPVMYCNEGGGYVEWIPSRQATSMDILRSTDGGETWVAILENVNPVYYTAKNKGIYQDEVVANSMYKVVVRDDQGNVAESDPTNVAGVENKYKKTATQITPDGPLGIGNYYGSKGSYSLTTFGEVNNRPITPDVNLLKDGSFEAGTGAWTAMVDGDLQVVEDATAPEGSKSLYFDSSATATAQWYKFTVDIKPNTEYVFSAWVKGSFLSPLNSGHASIGVIDPTTDRFMTCPDYRNRASRDIRQIYPPAWDGQWHLRSVRFNSGSLTQITIALHGEGSQMWVDDMALYENGQGVKYVGENMGGSVSYYVSDVEYCEDEDSLTGNVRMDDAASDYWQTGHGWNNGFMSFAPNSYEYGTSLKYTGSEQSSGVYYIKWVEVKPYTNYVFSADIRVLESGAGKLVLLDGKLGTPISFLQVDFDTDSYGDGWFPFNIGLNTSAYTRLGIAVCDLGGSALIDNLRLFDPADAADGQDAYNGWVVDEFGDAMYLVDGVPQTNQWIQHEGTWYYMGADGYMVTDKWVMDSVGWCYLGEDGRCVTNQWVADSVGWCYLDENGRMATNKWIKDSMGWCYVGADGYCVTNKWVADSKGWCYLDGSGRMATSKWIMDSVGWCYVGTDGYCVTNKWVADSKGWCYLDANGRMVTSKWVADSKGWCYVGADGYCVTNKWVADSKGWCYLDANGRMVYNTTVDGYYINANGYWVPDK